MNCPRYSSQSGRGISNRPCSRPDKDSHAPIRHNGGMTDDDIIQLIETFNFDAGPVAVERRNRGFTLIHAETGVPIASPASHRTRRSRRHPLLVTLERTMDAVRPLWTHCRSRRTGRAHYRGSINLLGRRLKQADKNPQSRALKATLERLVDFDLINTGRTRFSVGAVNVQTGNFVYFDNTTHVIGPEHVMASGSLPPGLPATEIQGEHYWDGGLVSNTPLQWVIAM